MSDLNDFLRGAIAMGHAIAALFFLRFYRRTGDRLFVIFCASFLLLAGIRLAMVFIADPMEHRYLYWIRFVAYALILAAIVDKNWPRREKGAEGKERP